MDKITLSPSKLNVFRECPRCFYDAEVLKIPRPRGIFPSLPGGMDLTLKSYFDRYRGENNLPFPLTGRIPGARLFPNQTQMQKMRFWRTAPRLVMADINVEVYGALDDLLVFNTQQGEKFSPFDHKTRGSAPKTDGVEYYGLQMDIYGLLLQANGFPIIPSAYLAYYWPAKVDIDNEHMELNIAGVPIIFAVEIKCLVIDLQRAGNTIREAVKVLRGSRPEPSETCEYCDLVRKKSAIHTQNKQIV